MAALACLEEEDHIARMEIGQRVEEKVVTGLFLLGVEFGFFVRVREEAGHVCEQMTMTEIVSLQSFKQQESKKHTGMSHPSKLT